MKYKLINAVNPSYSATQQILTNRGIPLEKINDYINSTEEDINSPHEFGAAMDAGVDLLLSAIKKEEDVLIIVDADCDGFTSSALLINYLDLTFEAWAASHVKFFLHSDKQHGLHDCYEYVLNKKPYIVILPDSSSNDYSYHKIMQENNIKVLVLDHHEAEKISEDAIVINNQLSNYPNKDLSGVGVTWQFCRAIDEKLNIYNANGYLDLVALGNTADMVSMRSIETKHLIQEGFKEKNIKNPFIYGMSQKNAYSLGDKITPMGAAFYIAPFVNAIVRSGTLDEKELVFKSMLKRTAFEEVLSNKRGHKIGEKERLLDQALRCVTNVKKRQTNAQEKGLAFLNNQIKERKLLEHKAIVLTVAAGQVEKNIAGLIANKLASEYQRPCCILTEFVDEDGVKSYRGSARGYEKTGLSDFRQICLNTGCVIYAEGHGNAFGLAVNETEIENFVKSIDEQLKDLKQEVLYFVDYIYQNPSIVSGNSIIEIARMDNLWGKDIDEPFVALEKVRIAAKDVTVYRKKNNTLKLRYNDDINIIMFNAPEELCEKLETQKGFTTVNIVGTCALNEWNGNQYAQILLTDIEEVQVSDFIF